MKTSFLSLFIAAVAVVGSVGCASKCDTVCPEVNTCDVTEREYQMDCRNFCQNVEAFEERASAKGADDCSAKFDEYMSCWESNKAKVCEVGFEGCAAAGEAWSGCLSAFCIAHGESGDHACVPVTKGGEIVGYVPAFAPF